MREERVFESRGQFLVKTRKQTLRFTGPASRGRRIRRNDVPGSGRYLKARLPRAESSSGIALDATLRAAAPHQLSRRLSGACPEGDGSTETGHTPQSSPQNIVTILSHDLREKVLSRRTGASVLFCVDASGSMGTEEVMGQVKAIVLGLLTDVYQKRDRLALLSFRGTEARQALPFTTSVELAHKKLKTLPTGGKSPLALALAKSIQLLKREVNQAPGRTPLLVLLTDGRANISMAGADPYDEALHQARRIRKLGVRTLVVDTDLTWIDSYPYARILAEAMGAKCLRLADLEAEKIVEFILG